MNQIKTKESDHSSISIENSNDIIFQLFWEQMKEENYEYVIDFDDCSF